MKYDTTKSVEIECRGETFTVELRMISLREKTELVDDNGNFSTQKFFESSIAGIKGPEVNGKAITSGADVLDSQGLDTLYLGILKELNTWNLTEDEIKNF